MTSTINVELDMFSRIKNPNWDLSEEETSQLVKDIRTWQYHEKVSKSENVFYPPTLGYRGFILVPEAPIHAGFKALNKNHELYIAEMRVYDWQVFVTEPNGTIRCFEDITYLEDKLMNVAKEKGYSPRLK